MNGLDPKEFVDELMLMARNDGDSFRKRKDSTRAVELAFVNFQRRRRQEERELFEQYKKSVAAEILGYWTEGE